MKGILADNNVVGQVAYLVQLMQAEPWEDFWKELGLVLHRFEDNAHSTAAQHGHNAIALGHYGSRRESSSADRIAACGNWITGSCYSRLAGGGLRGSNLGRCSLQRNSPRRFPGCSGGDRLFSCIK